jgi:hypothetical protein
MNKAISAGKESNDLTDTYGKPNVRERTNVLSRTLLAHIDTVGRVSLDVMDYDAFESGVVQH